jgi:hypothetical protein
MKKTAKFIPSPVKISRYINRVLDSDVAFLDDKLDAGFSGGDCRDMFDQRRTGTKNLNHIVQASGTFARRFKALSKTDEIR